MNYAVVPPRTVYLDAARRLRFYNDGDKPVVIRWCGEDEMPYRIVETTPEEDRESKTLFINHRGIADGSGRWISRNTRGATTQGTGTESDRPLEREGEAVADNNATPTEPTDVRLNIFKLFE